MAFSFERTRIPEVIIVTPAVYADERGAFFETYKRSDFAAGGISESFVQDNHSISKKNVLRGMHYQRGPSAQGKLVTVVRGAVLDVAVDLRPTSPTYRQWVSIRLDADNKKLFYIPPGFAHGFLSLEDDTDFVYKCTQEYAKGSEGGFRFDDPTIDIGWGSTDPILSEKDAALPFVDTAA